MNTEHLVVLERLSALADHTRIRVLLILEGHELTVGELTAVLQLPQSTVSRHLRVLADDGWVVSRTDGTSHHYRMPLNELDPDARRLWFLVRDQVASASDQDGLRLRSVLSDRRRKSTEFFSTVAGRWDHIRAELFGSRAELAALLALLDERWTVGDLGCGTGQVSASLAPFVRRVIAVDASSAMLKAAAERLRALRSVECRGGELESLPIGDGELDAAILFLVLHYVAEPPRVLAEVHRALKPGGRLLVVDMLPHDRDQYRLEMGHVWQGFSEKQVNDWLSDTGLRMTRHVVLPPDPDAKGPPLFAITAQRDALDRAAQTARQDQMTPPVAEGPTGQHRTIKQ